MALRALPDGFLEQQRAGVRLLVRSSLVGPLAARAFAEAEPARWGVVVRRLAGGRRPHPVVQIPGCPDPLVVKALVRGGLLGALLPDLFSPGRAYAELLVAATLERAGVPVLPLAGAVLRLPFGALGPARIAVVSPYLEGARDFVDWLAARPRGVERQKTLGAAGAAVARMHAAGVVHRDLNLKNLLVGPDGGVWILDLGPSRLSAAAAGRRAANLARLYRSALKLKLAPGLLGARDLVAFRGGYRGAAAAPDAPATRGLFGAARRALRRSLPWHRVAWLLAGR